MSQYITEKEAWNLVRIFEVNRIPRLTAFSVVRLLQSWEKSRGMKWVIDRLKLLTSDLLVGDQAIRKHPDGSWVGPFRPIWRLARRGRSGLRNALRILRIYGRYKQGTVSLEEYKAFASSIDLPTDDYAVPGLDITAEDMWLAADAQYCASFDMSYDCLPTASSPYINGRYLCRSEFDPEMHVQTLDDCPRLVLKHYEFLSTLFVLRDRVIYERLQYQHDVVGGVSALTKDRGLKIRFVANPALLLQVALTRLKSALEEFLRSMPESCVYNQERGTTWIQERLIAGCLISSIDLSKCSDNLPAREQFLMLRTLFPKLSHDIDLFESISRSEWFTPVKGTFCIWTKGQPLGTNPSFACFTIFHIMLVRAVGGSARNFRVIGDDIVISDPALSDRVLGVYKDAKVEVSIHKSLFKNKRLAEFAGRFVDKYGVLPVYKASPLCITKDPLGYIRQYGLAGVKLIPKKYRPTFMAIALLPKPFGYGKLGLYSELPAQLVYELLVDRFKPTRNMHLSAAFKQWSSAIQPFTTSYLEESPSGWAVKGISQTQRLGEAKWVTGNPADLSGEVTRLEDHVQSWSGTPLEDVPQQIKELEPILKRGSVPRGLAHREDTYRQEPVKPIGFIRKVFKLIKQLIRD